MAHPLGGLPKKIKTLQCKALKIKAGATRRIHRLGDPVVNKVPAYVCDIPGGFGGLIGWEFLRNFDFSIDFTSSQITLVNPQYPDLQKETFCNERYLDRIPFLYDKNIKIIACFENNGPRRFVFDTGETYSALHVDPSIDTAVAGSESRTSMQIGHFVYDDAKFLYYDLSGIHEISRY